MPRVVVRNAQRKLRIDLNELQQFAESALVLCVPEKSGGASDLEMLDDVNVVLISDARMAALHRKFMNISSPTDVITFQHGDVFISVETAERQAREFGTSTKDELRLYLVHALLHLHGFDDTTSASRRRMERVQSRVARAAARLN